MRISSPRPQKQSEQITYENLCDSQERDENTKTPSKRASSVIKKLRVRIYTWEQPTLFVYSLQRLLVGSYRGDDAETQENWTQIKRVTK